MEWSRVCHPIVLQLRGHRMAPVVASGIYPAVRRFLEESELPKSVKAFDKDTTTEEAPAKSKKAKALADLELVAASQLWLDAQSAKPRIVEAADIYPALRRFFVEAGLQRSLKAFDKETAFDEEAPAKSKKAKALADLELTAASQLWLDRDSPAQNGAVVEAEAEEPKKKKKRKAEEAVEEAELEEEEPKQKKAKKQKAAEEAEAAPEVSEQSAKPNKKEKKEKIAGTPFQRIDCAKWTKTIKDERLKDNTHAAKEKFGADAGDIWGNSAAEDLGRVKGKGFRKEMAKKKRSSWRGGGEINQGDNSIKFSDSEDE